MQPIALTFAVLLAALPSTACARDRGASDPAVPPLASGTLETRAASIGPTAPPAPAPVEHGAAPRPSAAAPEPTPLADAAAAEKGKKAEPAPPAGDDAFTKFKQRVEAAKTDPEATAKLFVEAFVVYDRDEELGGQLMALMLDDPQRVPDSDEPSGFRLSKTTREDLTMLDERPQVYAGYCGGTPAQEYKDAKFDPCVPKLDKEYSSRGQGINVPKEGRAKYFVANGGSSRPRPMELELKDGRWYVRGWSSLLLGVAMPGDD